VVKDDASITGGAASTERPTESLSLNFTKVEYKYTP
jgi:type VI protein secretion system component Hcp